MEPGRKSAAAVTFIEVSEDEAGQRIDNFLLSRLKGVPKSRIYRLLRKGEVRVNMGRIKPEYRLRVGDSLRLPPVRTGTGNPVEKPGAALRRRLDDAILMEDDLFLVVNKPAGLAVHGGSGINLGLIEALREIRSGESYLELVHRIDRDTSGCLLLARKRSALRHLQRQLREGTVDKVYLALVTGSWEKGLEAVDFPLRKFTLKSGEWFVKADGEGKRAVTHFEVSARYRGATLLRARLETGRTHQIRVHCKLAGHPLAGDDKYGDPETNRRMKEAGLGRMFLHAAGLAFAHPVSGERIKVEAPLPPDLIDCLDELEAAK